MPRQHCAALVPGEQPPAAATRQGLPSGSSDTGLWANLAPGVGVPAAVHASTAHLRASPEFARWRECRGLTEGGVARIERGVALHRVRTLPAAAPLSRVHLATCRAHACTRRRLPAHDPLFAHPTAWLSACDWKPMRGGKGMQLGPPSFSPNCRSVW